MGISGFTCAQCRRGVLFIDGSLCNRCAAIRDSQGQGVSLIIGAKYHIGFNTAKEMGDEMAAYHHVRCEAFGADWAVFRTEDGEPLTTTFDNLTDFVDDIGN